MKTVVQRVSHAKVTVDGQVTGKIDQGLLLFVGIGEEDTMDEVTWQADKVLKLRIFEDEAGKMNRSVTDVNGGLLVVSQFTLYGNVRNGTRPSFVKAAGPEKAEELYDNMVSYLKEKSELAVETGQFAAHMDVALENDGPVTIILER